MFKIVFNIEINQTQTYSPGSCMGGKKSILDHALVPKCRVLSKEEKEELLKKYGVTENKLPKILESDPVVVELNAKKGDVVEFERNSPVAGKSFYYRVVV